MSISIDVDRIAGVLLSSGWIEVADNRDNVSSFGLDAYEYVWSGGGGSTLLHGGSEEAAGIPSTGFHFTATDGTQIMGPLMAIHAVRYAALTSEPEGS